MHLLDATMFWGPAGGVRRVVGAKHAALGAMCWKHTIVAPGAEAEADTLDCGGLRLPGACGYRIVLHPWLAARMIERCTPDIVEAADPYALGRAALHAARRLRVPAVAFCHSHVPSLLLRFTQQLGGEHFAVARRSDRAARQWLRRLYERFDLVLAPSYWVAEDLRASGLPQVIHQPLGVDCRVFSPMRRDLAWRETLLRDLGLEPDTHLLVYCGRFAPEKNLATLAAAVQRLGRGYALVAMGAGPAPPRGERVRLLPIEQDAANVARLMASADVFVHAGDRETFGLAVLEAMACGTPVVGSSARGGGELLRDAGVTVDTLDAGRWAEAIHAQVHSPAPALAVRAKQRALQHDWPRVLRGWMGRYASMVHARVPSPQTRPARPHIPFDSPMVSR